MVRSTIPRRFRRRKPDTHRISVWTASINIGYVVEVRHGGDWFPVGIVHFDRAAAEAALKAAKENTHEYAF